MSDNDELQSLQGRKDGLHSKVQLGGFVAAAASTIVMVITYTSSESSQARVPHLLHSDIPMRLLGLRLVLMYASTLTAIVGVLLAFFPEEILRTSMRLEVFRNPTQCLHVLSVCSIFVIVGPALMMLNKDIMQTLGFNYPMSLSLLGLAASAAISRILVALGIATIREQCADVVSGSNWYWTILPISLCRALTLATGNAVYMYLGLGFIQMLKAFTPTIVLIVMRIAGVAKPSRVAVGFVMVIVLGTLLEVKGELHVTALGLLLIFASELCEAVSIVFIQKLLQNERFNSIETMYFLSPPGAAFLLLAAAAFEWQDMITKGRYALLAQYPSSFICAAFLGVAVNFVGYMVVQATSSLTCKILNTARCIGLVFIGVVVYGETVGSLERLGYSVALVGVLGYNFTQIFPQQSEKIERTFDDRVGKN